MYFFNDNTVENTLIRGSNSGAGRVKAAGAVCFVFIALGSFALGLYFFILTLVKVKSSV